MQTDADETAAKRNVFYLPGVHQLSREAFPCVASVSARVGREICGRELSLQHSHNVSWRSETLAKLQAKEQATILPVRFIYGRYRYER